MRKLLRFNGTGAVPELNDVSGVSGVKQQHNAQKHARLDSLLALNSFVPGVCVVVEHQGVVAQNLDIFFAPA